MTENDLLEAVANTVRQAYEGPGVTQTVPELSTYDLEVARMVIARVRQHDRQSQVVEPVDGEL